MGRNPLPKDRKKVRGQYSVLPDVEEKLKRLATLNEVRLSQYVGGVLTRHVTDAVVPEDIASE